MKQLHFIPAAGLWVLLSVAACMAQLTPFEVAELLENSRHNEASKDAEAVILYQSEIVHIMDRQTCMKEEEVLLKLITSQSKNKYGDLRMLFDSRYETFDLIEARTYTPEQVLVPIMDGADNIIVPPFIADHVEYAFIKQRVISFSGAEPGAVLHWHIKRTVRYPEGERFIWGSHSFQDSVPILKDVFVLKTENTVTTSYRLQNGAGSPQIQTDAGVQSFTWAVESIPMLKPEWDMVPLSNLVPRVLYTTARSWDEIGEWFRSHFEPGAVLTEELADFTDNLVAGLPVDPTMVNRVYRFVSDNIRDLKIPMMLGGYIPKDCSLTFSKRSGTSVDKSLLLTTMLRHCGFEADPVLTQSQNIRVPADFPSGEPFSRAGVVVRIGRKDSIWLDPEGFHLQPGVVVNGQGSLALRVSPRETDVEYMPVLKPEQSISLQEMAIELRDDGSARISLKWKGTGYFDYAARAVFRDMTPVEREVYFQNLIGAMEPTARIESIEQPDWKDLNRSSFVEIDLECRSFSVLEGDVTVVPIPGFPFSFGRHQIPSGADRIHPVQMPPPSIEQLHVTLDIPDGHGIIYAPGEKEMSSHGLKIRQRSEQKGSRYELFRKSIFRSPELQPKQFMKSRQVYEAFALSKQNLILLERTGIQ